MPPQIYIFNLSLAFLTLVGIRRPKLHFDFQTHSDVTLGVYIKAFLANRLHIRVAPPCSRCLRTFAFPLASGCFLYQLKEAWREETSSPPWCSSVLVNARKVLKLTKRFLSHKKGHDTPHPVNSGHTPVVEYNSIKGERFSHKARTCTNWCDHGWASCLAEL